MTHVCEICGDDFSGRQKQVDHDHNPNLNKEAAFRGILCRRCNTTIGQLDDDPALCDRMAAYLRAHREKLATRAGK